MNFESAQRLACDPDRVSTHAFLPLLGFRDVKRQFRTDNSDPSIPRRKRTKVVKAKPRDIRYAAHADAAIYSYYAGLLQHRYEQFLRTTSISDCVIGYRSGLGSNIDMAAEVFADVRRRGDCVALCFDISDFFPSISHEVLKSNLCRVLGVQRLDPDWYKVFKSITRFSSIELTDAARLEGFDPKSPPRPLVPAVGPAMKRLRAARLIATNKQPFGIPQGTPISAVFANVAMLAFDETVGSWCRQRSYTYRRYSDDIIVIASPSDEAEVLQYLVETLRKSDANLKINDDKTEISRFSVCQGHQTCDRELTYLGFTFDGQRVMLRARTISRYYRRMTYAVRSAARGAGRAGAPVTETFKRALFRDFTHLGRRSFYSYGRRSESKLAGSIIKRQLRKHFQILLRKLNNKGR